jgi:Mrp family chromosome partitioning ATPase
VATALTLATLAVAWLWPPTYVARATVVLESPADRPWASAQLPGPSEAAARLRTIALPPSEAAVVASRLAIEHDRVREAVSVSPTSARAFAVTVRARSPEAARDVANSVAARIVERAGAALGLDKQRGDASSLLESRAHELASFISAHPEVSVAGAANTKHTGKPDPALDVLQAEKLRLERKLASVKSSGSDNPYVDEPAELKRRLMKLDAALAARREAQRPAEIETPIAPELLNEWRRLLHAVAAARQHATSTAEPPPLVARVGRLAIAPAVPEAPNRALIAICGALLTLIASLATWFAGARYAARRSHSQSVPTAPPPEGEAAERPRAVQSRSTPTASRGGPSHHSSEPRSLPQPLPSASTASHAENEGIVLDTAKAHAALRPSTRPPAGPGGYSFSSRDATPDEAPPPQPTRAERNGRAPRDAAERMDAPEPTRARQPQTDRQKHTATLLQGSFVDPDVLAAREHTAAPVQRAAIPRSERISEAPPRTTLSVYQLPGWLPSPQLLPAERLAAICDELHQHRAGRCSVFAVASVPELNRDPARFATELAIALSRRARRVLLVESDFNHPSVHRTLQAEMPMSSGFSQQMHARIRGDAGTTWTVIECAPALHALTESRMRSPGLLHSYLYEAALTDLREHYELIVLSAGVLANSTDVRALDAVTDAFLLAAGADNATTAEAVGRRLFGAKFVSVPAAS